MAPRPLLVLALALLLAGPSLASRGPLGVRELLCDANVELLGCPRPAWTAAERTLRSADRGTATGHLALSPDGARLYVGSTARSDLGAQQYLVTAYDAATGQRAWSARHQGPAGSPQDRANGLAASADGSLVVVTGRSSGFVDDDFATVALDAATGALRWEARFDRGTDTAAAVDISPDSRVVYVAGTSAEDMLILAYDAADGRELWRTLFRPPGADIVAALAVAPDGSTVFVTGRTAPLGHGDFLTLALDAGSGAVRWATQEVESRPFEETATDVAVAPDGRVVVVTGITASHYVTVGYDTTTGTALWYQRETSGDEVDSHPPRLAVAGGAVIVVGRTFLTATNAFLTAAYDVGTGAPLWNARYLGSLATSEALAVGASAAAGRVYVSGTSFGVQGNQEIATVAYDLSSGAQAWVARLDRGSNTNAAASAVVVAPDGSRVFVSGTGSEEVALGSGATGWLTALTMAYPR